MQILLMKFNSTHFRANDEIDKLRVSSKGEIAKLEASLKKAEIRVASLEQTVEQKVRILSANHITLKRQFLI